jgi:hypothetical protein
MEVVSSKGFGLMKPTLFVVGQKTEAVNNRSNSKVFFFLNFKKGLPIR